MTFEAKDHHMKNLCLYNVIIHKKLGYYQILDKQGQKVVHKNVS